MCQPSSVQARLTTNIILALCRQLGSCWLSAVKGDDLWCGNSTCGGTMSHRVLVAGKLATTHCPVKDADAPDGLRT
jgi:hypothetical protein